MKIENYVLMFDFCYIILRQLFSIPISQSLFLRYSTHINMKAVYFAKVVHGNGCVRLRTIINVLFEMATKRIAAGIRRKIINKSKKKGKRKNKKKKEREMSE